MKKFQFFTNELKRSYDLYQLVGILFWQLSIVQAVFFESIR